MLDRRDFLKICLAATAAPTLILPDEANAFVSDEGLKPWLYMKEMPLFIKRGKDAFKIDLRRKGHFDTFRYATRDIKANVIGYPDPHLGGLISWMQATIAARTGKFHPFVITSGLRTQATNSRIEGAARNSMHLPDENGFFRAVDIHSPAVPPKEIAALAKLAQEGGVGIYSSRGFIHVDTGRVRTWGK